MPKRGTGRAGLMAMPLTGTAQGYDKFKLEETVEGASNIRKFFEVLEQQGHLASH